MRHLLILIFSISTFQNLINAERELKQVITLIRHGARFPIIGPINKYLSNNSKLGSDSQLRSQLTGNGLKMSYLLGNKMQSKYVDFLPQITKMSDIYKISAPNQRNQASSQAFFQGLFEKKLDQKVFDIPSRLYTPPFDGLSTDDSGIYYALPYNYYPIPTDTVSSLDSNIFDPWTSDQCHRFSEFSGNIEHVASKYFQAAVSTISSNETIQSLIPEIFDKDDKKNVDNQEQLYKLVDYFLSMQNLGQDFGIDPTVIESLHLSNAILASMFHFTEDALKVQATNLIDVITDKISLVEDNKEYPKIVALFGHDINIWAFLQIFKLSSTQCLKDQFDHKSPEHCFGPPEYAASLNFEVYKENNKITIGNKLIKLKKIFYKLITIEN